MQESGTRILPLAFLSAPAASAIAAATVDVEQWSLSWWLLFLLWPIL